MPRYPSHSKYTSKLYHEKRDDKPLRLFCEFLDFLIHSNATKAIRIIPPTAPTTPPMMAPFLLEEPTSPWHVR